MKKISKLFIIAKFIERIPAAFFGPIYSVYLLQNGLSLFQVSLVNFTYMITLALIDPSTGRLGDKYGHTRIYILGTAIFGLADLIYGSGSMIMIFIIAEITASIGKALMSEALEAKLKNSVRDDSEVHKAKADAKLLSQIGKLSLSAVSTLVLARFDNLSIGWYIAAAISLGGSGILLFLLRHEVVEEKEIRRNGTATRSEMSYKQAFRIIRHNPKLSFIAMLTFISYLAFQPLNMYWSPLLEQKTGGIELLGSFWVAVSLTIVVGQLLARRIKVAKIDRQMNLIMLAVTAVMILLATISSNVVLIALAFLLHEIPRSMQQTVLHTMTNRSDDEDEIPDEDRAFINSIFGSLTTLGSAIGLLGLGALTEFLTIQQVWSVSGGILLITTLLLWRKK
ncbi:MFS transporter [Candidatus Nomurabacteria bacterium]|nr:MFS transporter [Candidatus Nomurabacteria bacterium]MCB9803445.1 MFS transporter [Candidatus Nomurabacteria bacterium]